MIEIEKGVSIPPAKTIRKYPFHLMEVGDSFFTPGEKQILQSLAHFKRRNPDRKFTTRREGDGFRVWRTE